MLRHLTIALLMGVVWSGKTYAQTVADGYTIKFGKERVRP